MTTVQLYSGTFVDTPNNGALRIQHDMLMGVDDLGYISHFAQISHPTSQDLLSTPLVQAHKNAFFLPTFSDLHLHAPQYLYAGTGLDLPLMEWLDEYTYKAEERIDTEGGLAERVYGALVKRLIEVGTGCAVLFGTIGVEANLVLARVFQEAGVRAFVGKLSMDQSPRATYGEASPSAAMESVHTFLTRMQALVPTSGPALVQPILTPRFVPVCSDALLDSLGRLAKEKDLWVQSHMCESADQMAWVEGLRGKNDEEVFEEAGLLGPKTIQAHVTSLPPSLRGLVKAKGVAIAHCPLSNAYFSDAQFPLREALDEELKVGLGSDIAGGYALSIQQSSRQAVITSRLREGFRRERERQREREHETSASKSDSKLEQEGNLRVDWVEGLYVATRGGKAALGMGGLWEVGMEFDAQLLEYGKPDAPGDSSEFGSGALDLFDPLPVTADSRLKEKWWKEMIERWWAIGDERNRIGVWVQGRRLR